MSDRLDSTGRAFLAHDNFEDPSPSDLPESNNVRWVRRRKAQVVAAVRGGILSLHDALARYSLSLEEFIEWEREVGQELQERRRTGRMRELTKSRHGHGMGRRAN